ncbi:LacI family DNA-binding transcriptional regulator [Halobacillus locisalis]|uniref:LacI family DNA-binding transcriptional regulator n=1 Tax=Halobacillus locisalis TaxID=220753 RepID=A0A838CUU8_9BACI|nr:LacI family DNA-binding transcriptional regulator [Halobacillus locisalis]MBA2175535.1 LacI family DNA-binding transcriptional regulator [Halobacillus locisalis]
MTTINDIAQMANVSRTTVSRALNNSGYVSEDVRRRIMQIVEETGYMPNQSAKSLRTKRSGVIGVILPRLSTETSTRVVNGINEVLAKEGFQILLTDTELDKQKEIDYIRLLKSRHVDGIILLATNVNEALIQTIQQVDIPVLAIGQELPGVPSLVYDDYHAAADLTNMLVRKGHEKIGFIGVTRDDPSVGVLREQGYRDMMQQHGHQINEAWIGEGDFSIESGYEQVKTILRNSKSDRPTALFAVTDRMAIGAIEYLKEQGYAIPEDIAVVGIGASMMSKYMTPSLTTIDYHNKEAGKQAAHLLLRQLKNEKIDPKFELSYRLILRDSV